MHRYKIILEYIGAGYCGWQKQKESLSLQEIIENAIFSFSKERVTVTVAGRTDSGVNAYGQVAHFDLKKYYDPRKWLREGEVALITRLEDSFKDLNCENRN